MQRSKSSAYAPSAYAVGTKVCKTSGYPFPGEVVAVFATRTGKTRYVVECTAPQVEGCLHIFNGDQIEPRDLEGPAEG